MIGFETWRGNPVVKSPVKFPSPNQARVQRAVMDRDGPGIGTRDKRSEERRCGNEREEKAFHGSRWIC